MHIDCLFIYEYIFCRCFPHKGHRCRNSYFFFVFKFNFSWKMKHCPSEESVRLSVCPSVSGPKSLCVSDKVAFPVGSTGSEPAQRELLRYFGSTLMKKYVLPESIGDLWPHVKIEKKKPQQHLAVWRSIELRSQTATKHEGFSMFARVVPQVSPDQNFGLILRCGINFRILKGTLKNNPNETTIKIESDMQNLNQYYFTGLAHN